MKNLLIRTAVFLVALAAAWVATLWVLAPVWPLDPVDEATTRSLLVILAVFLASAPFSFLD